MTEDGVHIDREKIHHVKEWPAPKTVKEVISSLGLCSCYRKFIAGFAQMAQPLSKLIEKTSSFAWDEVVKSRSPT